MALNPPALPRGTSAGGLGRWLGWVGPLGAIALLGALVSLAERASTSRPSGAVPINRALFSAQSGAPPVAVSLPEDWRLLRPDTEVGWYRLQIPAEAQRWERPGLYMPQVNAGLTIWIDGAPARTEAQRLQEPPHDLKWYLPAYVPLPAGAREIRMRVQPRKVGEAWMGPLWVGEAEVLLPLYRQRWAQMVILPRLILFGMVAMATLMLSLWALRRSEALFGWFGAATLLWALRYGHLLDLRRDLASFDWVGAVGVGWMAIFMVPVLHALLGESRPRFERRLVGAGLAATALMPLFQALDVYTIPHALFVLGAVGVGVYPAARLLNAAWLRGDTELRWFTAAGAVLLGCGAHDAAVITGFLDRSHTYVLHLAALPCLLAISWVFMRRFVRAREMAEQLSRDLEQRVRDKHAELEANFQRLRTLERERAVASERERIMLDMHDGIGGHLVSSLSMLQSGPVDAASLRPVLQGALDDLRLMIQSLSPEETDLVTAVAMLRSTWQPRLEAAGLEVRWRIDLRVERPDLSPAAVLQILRIVQEAITNVLKHARASSLELRWGRREDGREVLEVVDDGVGLGAVSRGPEGLEGLGADDFRLSSESRVSSLLHDSSSSVKDAHLEGATDSNHLCDNNINPDARCSLQTTDNIHNQHNVPRGRDVLAGLEGRGIGHMRKRAHREGIQIAWHPGAGSRGTRVVLVLPRARREED